MPILIHTNKGFKLSNGSTSKKDSFSLAKQPFCMTCNMPDLCDSYYPIGGTADSWVHKSCWRKSEMIRLLKKGYFKDRFKNESD